MSTKSKSSNGVSAVHRNPYTVLELSSTATEDQIRASYKRLALKFHPDKNTGDPEASSKFQEVVYSYGILSDKEKKRNFDLNGFDGLNLAELDEDSLDLSNLGLVNTAVVAFFSKLGIPIKTSVSSSVLEEADNGTATIRPLPIGRPITGKVEKHQAHFFGCTLTESQAKCGVSIRVASGPHSKFKLLYFDQEASGRLNLVMQESSLHFPGASVAGFYFFGFQVHRLDPNVSPIEVARDPESALFRKLENMSPVEICKLRAGTHVFAVYGDNFYKPTQYTIEVAIVESQFEEKAHLQDVEKALLEKREELLRFETEYRQVVANFLAADARVKQEKLVVEDLIRQRTEIHRKFTSGMKPLNLSTISPTQGMPTVPTTGPTTPSPAHIPLSKDKGMSSGSCRVG